MLKDRADFLHCIAKRCFEQKAGIKDLPTSLAVTLKTDGQNSRDTNRTNLGQESLSVNKTVRDWKDVENDCMDQGVWPMRVPTTSLVLDQLSTVDAAVQLTKLAHLAPVAVISPLMTETRLERMPLHQIADFAVEMDLCVTSVEDLACYLASSQGHGN